MTLPPDITTHLHAAAGAALSEAIASAEGFISSAVGEPVSISSGPAGQLVIVPKAKRRPRNPARQASNILLPLLIGSAVMQLGGNRR